MALRRARRQRAAAQRSRWRVRLFVLIWVPLALIVELRSARAATRTHALIIANNQPFRTSAASAQSLATLRFADDDALAFHQFLEPILDGSELLTVMDAETQALYSGLVPKAQVPTLAAVRAAAGRLAARVKQQRARGHRNVLFVFFSGHGVLDAGGKPALALFDGGLNQEFLYREILERVEADEVHLLIDACHAEAIVRPRGAEAELVDVSPDQAQAFLVQSTLSRFPHVGAIVAATTHAKAHEWGTLRHGVFTYELLSALRGGADVNRDRNLEYSEVYAFMMAANRAVPDARARLSVAARPPESNRRTAIVRLSDFPTTHFAWISGVPGGSIIDFGDGLGRRLATLHCDRDAPLDVLLPAAATIYVRNGEAEARFEPSAGKIVSFDSLRFVPSNGRERGALEDALQRGLFASPYGRRYYEGIVDQNPGLIPVEFAPRDSRAQFWKNGPGRGSHLLVAGAGISRGIADVAPFAHGVSIGVRPRQESGLALSADLFGAWDGPLAEWQLHARGGWLWSLESGPVRGFGGAVAGVGLLTQQVEAAPSRRSLSASFGPVLGVSTRISEHFGIWSELQLFGLLHRRDDETVISAMPCVWWGGALRL